MERGSRNTRSRSKATSQKSVDTTAYSRSMSRLTASTSHGSTSTRTSSRSIRRHSTRTTETSESKRQRNRHTTKTSSHMTRHSRRETLESHLKRWTALPLRAAPRPGCQSLLPTPRPVHELVCAFIGPGSPVFWVSHGSYRQGLEFVDDTLPLIWRICP